MAILLGILWFICTAITVIVILYHVQGEDVVGVLILLLTFSAAVLGNPWAHLWAR